MIWAINRGRYPLDNADTQAKIRANLDDYARYLLGAAPERTNTSIPLHETVRVGDAFGDIIQISRTSKSEFSLRTSSSAPQIVQETPDGRPLNTTSMLLLNREGFIRSRSSAVKVFSADTPAGP